MRFIYRGLSNTLTQTRCIVVVRLVFVHVEFYVALNSFPSRATFRKPLGSRIIRAIKGTNNRHVEFGCTNNVENFFSLALVVDIRGNVRCRATLYIWTERTRRLKRISSLRPNISRIKCNIDGRGGRSRITR